MPRRQSFQNLGLDNRAAVCSSAAHRPKNLETTSWGRRTGHGEERGRDMTGTRNGWRRGQALTGQDRASPSLPLPGREPERPAPSLRRVDKGTGELPDPASRPDRAVGGLCHSGPRLLRTDPSTLLRSHPRTLTEASTGGLKGRPPCNLRKAGPRTRLANGELCFRPRGGSGCGTGRVARPCRLYVVGTGLPRYRKRTPEVVSICALPIRVGNARDFESTT